MNPRALISLGLALLLGGMALVTAALLPMLREQQGLGFLGGAARDTADGQVGELRTTSYPGGRHDLGDVTYREDPPMGGEHADFWQECGVFDHPVWDEGVVHALEHGTVWLAHDPGLDADDLADLAELLPDEGIMSPREGLPGDVVITVWNAQLALAKVDVGELEAFVDEYADGHTAPEPQGSCEGGLDVTEDGVADLPTVGSHGTVAGWTA